MPGSYPLGKLPPDVLAALLARHPIRDPRVVIGPRPGEDAAVIDIGDQYLLTKTDPITFASEEIGWYAVNVNANDIATMGGMPQWFMATILFPEAETTRSLVERIFAQIAAACDALKITLVGGHSEITYGINRPIISGMMLGLVEKDRLVTSSGAEPGDALLVTKGVPIEATAIIARERKALLRAQFSEEFLAQCAHYLHTPGISVVRDALLATSAGRVHAMHDPTEGGLATGLWEMAEASGKRLVVNPSAAILEDGRTLCAATGLDPLGAIASGALLMAVHPDDGASVASALQNEGITAYHIGYVEDGPVEVIASGAKTRPLPRPSRDEITKLFES